MPPQTRSFFKQVQFGPRKIKALARLIAGILTFLLAGLITTAGTKLHAAEAVDLELVLAVDVSSSVDTYEARLQRQGYVAAMLNPVILDAITTGPLGRIAVLYVEWAGEDFQRIIGSWTIIQDRASAAAYSRMLAGSTISSAPYTSISTLIDFASFQIRSNKIVGNRRVIDISGDGPNSDGRLVRHARDDAVGHGITINGLPVLSSRPGKDGLGGPSVYLLSYFKRNVIGGSGAFAIEVNEYENFGKTLIEKLRREIKAAKVPKFSRRSQPPSRRRQPMKTSTPATMVNAKPRTAGATDSVKTNKRPAMIKSAAATPLNWRWFGLGGVM